MSTQLNSTSHSRSSVRSRSTPRIFVSHNHKDHDFGIRLVQDLRRSLGNEDAVWYDRSGGLRVGDKWWKKIQKELRERNVFIVLLSQSANRSKFVREEIDIALHQSVTRGMLIIPIVILKCRIPENLKRIHTIFYLQQNDYNTVLQEVLNTLEKSFKIKRSTSSDILHPVDEVGISHIQFMIPHMKEAFDQEDWHYVIAVAKALISQYPNTAIPASIYKMLGSAYLYADKIYDDQEALAQEALKQALVFVSDPEQRLELLDAYTGPYISQGRWREIEPYYNEALQLAPYDLTWQALKNEIDKRTGQNENKRGVSYNHTAKNENNHRNEKEKKSSLEDHPSVEVPSPTVVDISSNEALPFKLNVSWHSWHDFDISIRNKSSEIHLYKKQAWFK